MALEKLLVVDDENLWRDQLIQYLREQNYEVTGAENLQTARKLLLRDSFDLIFLDLKLPDGSGLELLEELEQHQPKIIVVVMTGYASFESAVECVRHHAFDYLPKPFPLKQLDFIFQKANDYQKLVNVAEYYSQNTGDEDNWEILGRSAGVEQLRQMIRRVGRTRATVLIHGETGTGKELVARAIHQQSANANAPFIKVNCAAIPENLVESEFFGHEKGAFTGALSRREGRFELANGGTILLDEVSEVSLAVQAKLLRVLQEHELERVGGNRTIKVDVRVIATTNRHLEESVQRKEFRQDLFFRLNVVPIHVPPLRERREDIPLLAEEFMKRFIRKHGAGCHGLAHSCIQELAKYDWPGNIRELQNVVERAVILCGENCETCEQKSLEWLVKPHPSLVLTGPGAVPKANSALNSAVAAITSEDGQLMPLDEMEKRYILTALEKCGNNRTQAAKAMGISVRTLRNKLNEYSGKNTASDLSSDDDENAAT